METISIHPIFNQACVYIDHPIGELQALGDALGRDCMVCRMTNNGNGFLMSTHKNDGKSNEDWFGWQVDVLSPISGTVTEVYINPTVNVPGKQNPSRASSITIQDGDGTCVSLSHFQGLKVKEGDTVTQGQIIAKVGNDGYARNPHVHIGAWYDEEPLAIEFDRQLMADLKEKVGEIFWLFGTDDIELS